MLHQLAMQECLRHLEFAVNGCGRNLQRGGGLFVGQTSKTKQFDDFAFPPILFRQPLESQIKLNDSGSHLWPDHYRFIELDLFRATAALAAMICLRMIDQNTAKHARREREKMNPILPFDVRIDQPEIRFVYQGRRAERMIRALGSHAFRREPVQLIVYHRYQLIESTLVTRVPLPEKTRY